jgi:uncharacterized repeat protein (TIGR01451 family)
MSLDGTSTTTTDNNGYYSFTGTNCFVSHNVSYSNNTPYISDSAQFEQNSQQVSTTMVVVPVGSFNPLGDSVSPSNNFGLALYDLHIDKSVDDAYKSDGATATYTIVFGNHGPSDAINAVLTDSFDGTKLIPDTTSLSLGTLPNTVVATWTANSLVLSNLPVLKKNDRYTISFKAKLSGKDEDVWNRTNIFVGNPEADPLEKMIFANNRDEVKVKVVMKVEVGGGNPTTVVQQPLPTPPVVVKEEITATPTTVVAKEIVKKNLLTLSEENTDSEGEHLSALPNILPKTGSKESLFMILFI